MKVFRRLVCLILVAVMLFGLSGVSLAAGETATTGSVNLKLESLNGGLYRVVFNATFADTNGPKEIYTRWFVDTSVVQLADSTGTALTVSSDLASCFAVNESLNPQVQQGGGAVGKYVIPSASWTAVTGGYECSVKVSTEYNTDNITSGSAKDYYYLYFKAKDGQSLYNGCIQVRANGATYLLNSAKKYTLDNAQFLKSTSWQKKITSVSITPDSATIAVVNSANKYQQYSATCIDVCNDTLSASEVSGKLTWSVKKKNSPTDLVDYPGISINASGYVTVVSSTVEEGTLVVSAVSTSDNTVKASVETSITKVAPALKSLTMKSNTSITIPEAGQKANTYTFTYEGVDQYGNDFTSFGTPTISFVGTAPTGVSIEGSKISVSNEASKNSSLTFKVKAVAQTIESNEVTVTLVLGDTNLSSFNLSSEYPFLNVPKTGEDAALSKISPVDGIDKYGNAVDATKAFNGITYKVYLNSDTSEYKGDGIKVVDGTLTVTTDAVKQFKSASSISVTIKATTTNGKTASTTVVLYKETSVATEFDIYNGTELLTKFTNTNNNRYGSDSVTIPTGDDETVTYTVKVKDQYGQAMEDDTTKAAIAWDEIGASDTNVTLDSSGFSATLTVTKNASKTTSDTYHTVRVKYNKVVKAFVDVSIVDMEVAWPTTVFTAGSFKYGVKVGDMLDSSKYSGKASGSLDGKTYNGTFAVSYEDSKTDTKTVPPVGDFRVTLTFTISDSGALKGRKYTKTYTVAVEKADPTSSILDFTVPSDHAYNGEAQGIGTVSVKETLADETVFGSVGAVSYYLNGQPANPINPGTYTVKVTYTAGVTKDNYVTKEITLTENYKIAKADVSKTAQVTVELGNAEDLVYNGNEFKPTVKLKVVGKNASTIIDADDNYTIEYKDNTDAGTKAQVVVKADADSKYLTGTVTKEFTIGKLDLSDKTDVTLTLNEKTYNASAQRNITGTLKLGQKGTEWTIKIGEDEGEKTLDDLKLKAVFSSVPCDAKEYTVTLEPEDPTDCNFSGSVSAKYYINPAVITDVDISKVSITKVYDGKSDLPEIAQSQIVLKMGTDKKTAIPDGENTTGRTVYVQYTLTPEKLTASEYATDAGTYTAKLSISDTLAGTAAGNYEFDDDVKLTREVAYKITPRPITGDVEIGWDTDAGTKGTYDVGDTLKETDITFDVPAALAKEAADDMVSYQWYRNGVLVKNATGSTYKIDTDDANTTITVKKSVKSGSTNFTGSIISNGITVGKAALAGKVTVAADEDVTELIAEFKPDEIEPKETTDYIYVWLRNGVVITGENSTKYKITEADLGKAVTCRVDSVASGGFTGSVTSDATDVPVRKVGKPTVTFTSIAATAASFDITADLFGNDYATYTVEVYKGTGNSKTSVQKLGEVTSPCTVSGLEAKQSYTIAVTAKGNIKTDAITGTYTFTTTVEASASKLEVNAVNSSVVNLTALNEAVERLVDEGTLVINTTGGYVEMSVSQALNIEDKDILVEVKSAAGNITLTKGVFNKMATELKGKTATGTVKFAVTKVKAGNNLVEAYTERGNTCYRFAITINGLESTSFASTDLIKVAVPAEKDKEGVLGLSNGVTSYTKSVTVSGDMLYVNIPAQIFFTVVSKDEKAIMPFKDVPENQWYYQYVQYVYEHGLMSGSGENFSPLAYTTREQMIQVLYNMEGTPGVKGTDIAKTMQEMPDVKDTWYTDAVVWAYTNKVTSGMTDSTGKKIFGVGTNLTREMLVTMLYNYEKGLGKDVSSTVDLDTFEDGEDVSSWAAPAFKWAISKGIIGGKKITVDGETTLLLDPQGLATRAELATILTQYTK